MAKNNIVPTDTLATKFDTLRTGIKSGLMDLLGEDLYSILETKKIKGDMPFGFESRFDIQDRSLNLRKKWGKDWQFDLDVAKPNPWEVRMTLKKEI